MLEVMVDTAEVLGKTEETGSILCKITKKDILTVNTAQNQELLASAEQEDCASTQTEH